MSIFTKVSADVARDMERIFGSRGYTSQINTTAIEQVIKISIQKPAVLRAVQDLAKKDIANYQNEVRKEILAGLLGSTSTYKATDIMFDQIKQIRTLRTDSAKSIDNWIRKYHSGDWYSYKGGLAKKRLYQSGAGRFKGYSVVAQQKVLNKKSAEITKPVAVDADGGTSSNFPKKFKHTLIVNNDPENGGFKDPNFNNEHSRLRRELADKNIVHSYSRAKELLLSKQAVERGHLTLSGGGTAKAFRIPYAKTGTLARSLSRSFSILNTTYKNTDKDLGQFNFTTTYTLATEQLPNDVHDAWRFARRDYHTIVYVGTSNIAIEYLKKVLKARL